MASRPTWPGCAPPPALARSSNGFRLTRLPGGSPHAPVTIPKPGRSAAARTSSCWPASPSTPSSTSPAASARTAGASWSRSAGSPRGRAFSVPRAARSRRRAGTTSVDGRGSRLERADPLDALAAQAVGADAGGLVGAAVVDADGLEVRQPPPLGLVHRVADVVPGHGPLAAYIASLGHNRRIVSENGRWRQAGGRRARLGFPGTRGALHDRHPARRARVREVHRGRHLLLAEVPGRPQRPERLPGAGR